METTLNGIIYDGKVYEAVKGTYSCIDCALREYDGEYCGAPCNLFDTCKDSDPRPIFRYSQSLTEKLNTK